MKVILLLGGRSKRFWPLREKSLFPVCGVTLLEHQLNALSRAGFKDVTIVGGAHNLSAIRSQFPKLQAVKQEDLDLGMQGALLSALPKIKDKPVLIISGNDVTDSSAFQALKNAATKGRGAVLAKKVKRYFPGGYLTVKAGRVRSVVEKPGEGKEPSDLINIVAHIHPSASKLLAELRKHRSERDDGYERALTALAQDTEYRAVPYNGFWQPVKYPWHLLDLLPHFLETYAKRFKGGKATIHRTAVIEGKVTIGSGVRVLPHATIVGPATIGDNTIIGTNALVRGSSVGRGSVIGYGTEIKGSILGDGVWTHMAYIGDSVVGSNVAFGGGCTTGNFRLDESEIASVVDGEKIPTGRTKFGAVLGEGVRLGIQVGINPGVKICGGSFIAGGVYLEEDVRQESFVSMKNGMLITRPNKFSTKPAENREKYQKTL
ncbi:MAG: NTP transferase domain-containing protein [Patescibacteria group bacterium]